MYFLRLLGRAFQGKTISTYFLKQNIFQVRRYGERSVPALECMFTKPTGNLTEWRVKTNVFKTLNLEFDREIFSNSLHITSPDKRSFLLKLIPMGYGFVILVYLTLNRYSHRIGSICVT